MAASSSYYGLVPINLQGGAPSTGGSFREFPMTANVATAIYTGDVIVMASGLPIPATSTPTTSTTGLLGVCVGVRYQDPTLKQFQYSQYLPAGAYTAGYRNIWIRVADDPNQLFMVQADGSISATYYGKTAQLGNFGGNTITGKSTVNLVTASVATTATYAVKIIDFMNAGSLFPAGSAPADSYTDCIVRWNFTVHSYTAATGAA